MPSGGKLAFRVALVLTGVALIGKYAPPHADVAAAGPITASGIPAHYLAEYRAAGHTCRGLDWAILAGIGKVETNHGRSRLPGVRSGSNSAGAEGPMQFLPATFAAVRRHHSDVGSDIYSPDDAIPAAAHLLCDDGYTRDPYSAIYAYNHAGWYVAEVRQAAAHYRAAAS